MEPLLFWPLVAVIFLLMVTVLVAAHEYGHYLFARLFKMEVEEFSIGFGHKPLFTFHRKGDTAFTVRPWPLGGFVRIKGMVPQPDGSETQVEGGFYSKPPGHRFWVLLAGPLFSVIAGLLVLIPLYAIVGEPKFATMAVAGEVPAETPAYGAGLRAGDTIVSVGEKEVSTFYELILVVQDLPERPVDVEFERAGKRQKVSITPIRDKNPMPIRGPDLKFKEEKKIQSRLGIIPAIVNVRLPIHKAAIAALKEPVKMVTGLYALFQKPKEIKEQVGGPLAIFYATAEVARTGMDKVFYLTGLLSIWLGIFNLLPVPLVFDGGHMAVALTEMLRGGRRISFRMQSWLAGVGITLVAILIVGVMAVDINRFFIEPFTSKKQETTSAKALESPVQK